MISSCEPPLSEIVRYAARGCRIRREAWRAISRRLNRCAFRCHADDARRSSICRQAGGLTLTKVNSTALSVGVTVC
ncbi:hypothetical protein KCP78_03520 [Salmonella enterica subsp. enterica]|nr:hypothetical protein KCP78_03520 [Salmonella enterica subsp. enterica]